MFQEIGSAATVGEAYQIKEFLIDKKPIDAGHSLLKILKTNFHKFYRFSKV
jgi:hypothetical protein